MPCTSSPPLSIFQIRRKSPEVASRSGAFPRQDDAEGEGAPPTDPERSGMNATRVGGNGWSNPRAGSALRTPASSSTEREYYFVGALANGEETRERKGT